MSELITNEATTSNVNNLMLSYENAIINDGYFKDKLSFKNKFIYFNDKRLDWKNDKSLFRSIIAK